MFTKWRMKNFKSIETLDLALGQVNVFAGANSSGKSTILQSILLLKQTVQYAPPARALALNGPILKLGSFSDVHNAFCEHDRTISLGFSLNTERVPRNGVRNMMMSSRQVRSVSAELNWVTPVSSQAPEQSEDVAAALSPVLSSAAYDVTGESENTKTAKFSASIAANGGAPSTETAYTHVVTKIDEASGKELTGGKPDAEIVGATTSHFLMNFVGVRYELTKLRARRVAEQICGTNDPFDQTPYYAPFILVETVKNWLSEISVDDFDSYFDHLVPDNDDDVPVSEVADAFRHLKQSVTNSADSAVTAKLLDDQSLKAAIEARLIQAWGPLTTIDETAPRSIVAANDKIRTYLTSFVRYLGPLRDEPRHVYPLEALSQPDDVGYRGEHTAAVLELNSSKMIEYVSSEVFSADPEDWADNLTQATLRAAVVDWLTYVGVAIGFSASDKGVFGHQLKVRTVDGKGFHDLTNVGVGVSQVLPIIVGSLLAPKGSCLIFEQPELHLHPKVQARLADFFLAMGFSGKQCLLETHSEYLVDRLRLRIAQASGDEVAKRVKIFFTEKAGGVTTCTPVEISKYGAALKWPKDFFDQSQREVEAIVQAAGAKRRAESGARLRALRAAEPGRD
jgi:predicted ATPase